MRARSCAALLLGCWIVAWAIPAQADPFSDFGVIRPRVQMAAPDFSLASLDGKPSRLSDYRGKVVLLHFWATWCVPCRSEMPVIQRLGRSHSGQGLELLCVNVDRGNRDGIRKFMLDINLQFQTLLDPDGNVRNHYEVRALPTSYLVGRNGKTIGRIIGERKWDGPEAKALIKFLLAPEEGKPG